MTLAHLTTLLDTKRITSPKDVQNLWGWWVQGDDKDHGGNRHKPNGRVDERDITVVYAKDGTTISSTDRPAMDSSIRELIIYHPRISDNQVALVVAWLDRKYATV
jgi:hypothetical protein